MPELSFTLRLARPSVLSQLIDIDDQASVLYAQVGLTLALADDHPFVQAEAARWARAIDADSAHVALAPNGELLGFMTLGWVDGAPYLDQLAVRPRAMRRGIEGRDGSSGARQDALIR
jgi:hypothetical protein